MPKRYKRNNETVVALSVPAPCPERVLESRMGTAKNRRDSRSVTGKRIQWTRSLERELYDLYVASKPSVRGYLKRLVGLWQEAHPELPKIGVDSLVVRAKKFCGNITTDGQGAEAAPKPAKQASRVLPCSSKLDESESSSTDVPCLVGGSVPTQPQVGSGNSPTDEVDTSTHKESPGKKAKIVRDLVTWPSNSLTLVGQKRER